MSDFMLVHGAWHGPWSWDAVAAKLRRAGHRVVTPDLSVSPGTELASRDLTLGSHIDAVLDAVRSHDLTDLVLCGHSYGGMVVTGVADAVPGRVRALVYLDAFVPGDGDSLRSLSANFPHQAGLLPPPPASVWGLTGDLADWADARMGPQPAGTFDQPVALRGAFTGPRTYVLATGWPSLSHFQATARTVAGLPGWTVRELDGSHDLMLDCTDAVCAILVSLAG